MDLNDWWSQTSWSNGYWGFRTNTGWQVGDEAPDPSPQQKVTVIKETRKYNAALEQQGFIPPVVNKFVSVPPDMTTTNVTVPPLPSMPPIVYPTAPPVSVLLANIEALNPIKSTGP